MTYENTVEMRIALAKLWSYAKLLNLLLETDVIKGVELTYEIHAFYGNVSALNKFVNDLRMEHKLPAYNDRIERDIDKNYEKFDLITDLIINGDLGD